MSSEIYRWVDDKGQVHFDDSARPVLQGKAKERTKKEKVTLNISPSSWQRFDITIRTRDVQLTEQETLRIKSDVNNVYHFYDDVMYFDFYKTVPVSITLLADKQAYQRYLKKELGVNVSSSRGVFFTKTNEIAVYMRKDRNGTLETIKHEASHAIIASIAPNTPGWLNEGLAEQMEKIERKDGHLIMYRHEENKQRLSHRANMLPLREMLDLQSSQWRKKNVSGNSYLQAHSGELLYFLLSASPRKSFVVRILQEYKRGSRMRSLYLVRDNYIGGIGGMETSWEFWLRQKEKGFVVF
ncbi:MAG: DUF4124 domain-containing protein [Pseudomonadales bacterium]|nr:DUF4124 domain-containing protein [Pseudomonadales bacterium]